MYHTDITRTDGKHADKIITNGYKTTGAVIIGSPEHSTKEGRQNMKRYKINTLERTNKGLKARYYGSFDTYQEALEKKRQPLKKQSFRGFSINNRHGNIISKLFL